MYAAKRFSCGPGAERRDPTKQVYTKMFFYDPVVLVSCSSASQESSGVFLTVSGFPRQTAKRGAGAYIRKRDADGGYRRFP